MTRSANARIAGASFLIYIAAGIASMRMFGGVTSGPDAAAKVAGIGQHPTEVGMVILLTFVECFCALALAVTLYAVTRDEDRDIAMMGLVCRVAEGVIAGSSIFGTLALQGLAGAQESVASQALAAYLLRNDMAVTATFFAVGSLCFSWLFLRGRMIPAWLARLGLGASALLVACLPLEAAGFLRGPITSAQWLPMLVFEVWLGAVLLVKGVAAPARAQVAGV